MVVGKLRVTTKLREVVILNSGLTLVEVTGPTLQSSLEQASSEYFGGEEGSSDPEPGLDPFIEDGACLLLKKVNDLVQANLVLKYNIEVPYWVRAKLTSARGFTKAEWKSSRGFTYTAYGGGSPHLSFGVTGIPPGRSQYDGFTWRTQKAGLGSDILSALSESLLAPEIEISEGD